jgi:ABC-type phosphate/phosphonate transport system ATPase subunit
MSNFATGSPAHLAIAEKQRQALELRKAGATYHAIAQQLGYHDESGARYAVRAILQRVEVESADTYRALQLLELLDLRRAIIAHARNATGGESQLKAIDRLLKIQEREARLLGLDAPTTGLTIDVSQLSDEELEQAYQQVLRRHC